MRTMEKRKILYVHNAIHASRATGVHLRILNLGKLLKKFGRVTMVGIGFGTDPDTLASFTQEFGEVIYLPQIIEHPTNPIAKWCVKMFQHSPFWTAYKVSIEDQQRLWQIAKDYDIVWFHSLDAADAVKWKGRPNTVMDLDDLHSVKMKLFSQTQTRLRAKWAHKAKQLRWHIREKRALNRFEKIIVCSDADKSILHNRKHIHILPNGFERPEQEPKWQPRTQMKLGFIGTLNYEPNLDALLWFRDCIWPIIKKQAPQVQMRLIGIASKTVAHDFKDFEQLGFVEKTEQEMADWSALVVPLRVGGGTRLKVLEAFSKKCPVISTSVGVYGLGVENRRELIIADTPQIFANACLELLNRNAIAEPMVEKAWTLFNQRYAWDCQTEKVKAVLES